MRCNICMGELETAAPALHPGLCQGVEFGIRCAEVWSSRVCARQKQVRIAPGPDHHARLPTRPARAPSLQAAASCAAGRPPRSGHWAASAAERSSSSRRRSASAPAVPPRWSSAASTAWARGGCACRHELQTSAAGGEGSCLQPARARLDVWHLAALARHCCAVKSFSEAFQQVGSAVKPLSWVLRGRSSHFQFCHTFYICVPAVHM